MAFFGMANTNFSLQVDDCLVSNIRLRRDVSGRLRIIMENAQGGGLELDDSHKIEIKWLSHPAHERRWQRIDMHGLFDAMAISGLIPKYDPERDIPKLPLKTTELTRAPQVSKVAKKLMRAWEKGRGNADKLQRKLDRKKASGA